MLKEKNRRSYHNEAETREADTRKADTRKAETREENEDICQGPCLDH